MRRWRSLVGVLIAIAILFALGQCDRLTDDGLIFTIFGSGQAE